MSVILILLISSLVLASAFLAAFIWSVRSGQYDDGYTPSVRILFEDLKPKNNQEPSDSNEKQNGPRKDSSD